MKRHKCTNSEREYVRGMVHNLSFQRWTDKDIAAFLRDEKKIDVSRSTVSRLRKQVEKTAEKWYIELKKSSYKYIATYKERLDSLFYYQKKLHEIIHSTSKDEIKIRAICELHSIEMSVFNLWKQMPDLVIVDPRDIAHGQVNHGNDSDYINLHEIKPEDIDKVQPVSLCRCGGQIEHYICQKCLHAFCRPVVNLVDRIVICPDCNFEVYNPVNHPPICDIEDVNGLEAEPWDDKHWVKCARSCQRWFRAAVIDYHELKCEPKLE